MSSRLPSGPRVVDIVVVFSFSRSFLTFPFPITVGISVSRLGFVAQSGYGSRASISRDRSPNLYGGFFDHRLYIIMLEFFAKFSVSDSG